MIDWCVLLWSNLQFYMYETQARCLATFSLKARACASHACPMEASITKTTLSGLTALLTWPKQGDLLFPDCHLNKKPRPRELYRQHFFKVLMSSIILSSSMFKSFTRAIKPSMSPIPNSLLMNGFFSNGSRLSICSPVPMKITGLEDEVDYRPRSWVRSKYLSVAATALRAPPPLA